MKLVENFIEFDGSRVMIWKHKQSFFKRYYYEVLDDTLLYVNVLNVPLCSGSTFTRDKAKNEALSFILDKEWKNLPPRMKEANGSRRVGNR